MIDRFKRIKANFLKINEFTVIKKSFISKLNEGLKKNLLPFLKQTLLLYIFNNNNNNLITKYSMENNFEINENSVKIQTKRFFDEISYKKFQELIVIKGQQGFFKINGFSEDLNNEWK